MLVVLSVETTDHKEARRMIEEACRSGKLKLHLKTRGPVSGGSTKTVLEPGSVLVVDEKSHADPDLSVSAVAHVASRVSDDETTELVREAMQPWLEEQS